MSENATRAAWEARMRIRRAARAEAQAGAVANAMAAKEAGAHQAHHPQPPPPCGSSPPSLRARLPQTTPRLHGQHRTDRRPAESPASAHGQQIWPAPAPAPAVAAPEVKNEVKTTMQEPGPNVAVPPNFVVQALEPEYDPDPALRHCPRHPPRQVDQAGDGEVPVSPANRCPRDRSRAPAAAKATPATVTSAECRPTSSLTTSTLPATGFSCPRRQGC